MQKTAAPATHVATMDSSSALAAVQVASAAAATLALLVLAGRGVINSRVTKRQTTMGGARDAAVAPASLPASKPAGLMDKWYAAQPAGEKRYFVQALRVGGRAPSRAELSSALSLVAARHPQLLVLPHPTEDRLYSQITRAECIDEAGTILPFPLPAAVRCVGETIYDPAAAQGSDDAILKLMDALVNEPVDDDPSLEVFETLDRVAPTWNGVKLQVVVHAEAEADAKSFDLVLRMAHTVGDGMSGMLLLRHLLVELGEGRVRASAASAPARTTIPLAELVPLSSYPSMEDYFDVRPKVRRVVSLLWDGVATKVRKALGCAPEPWWDGRNEAGEIDASLSASSSSNSKRTRCTPIHLSPASLALVASAAKKNGCTVQAALSVAASYATAVSSGRRNLVLHVGTPLSTRGVCAAESAAAARSSAAGAATGKALLPPVDGVIGNFLALHMMDVALSTVAPATSAPRFWSLAQSYLKSLQTSRPHDLGTMGLIALVDIRAYIRDTHANLKNGRTSSVLVSNVGALDAAPSPSTTSTSTSSHLLPPSLLAPLGFELLDSFFAQPVASYVHSVFVVNAVSSARGGLRAIVASPEFLVTDQQAQRFKQAFEAALRNIAEGQDPTCQQVSAEVAQ